MNDFRASNPELTGSIRRVRLAVWHQIWLRLGAQAGGRPIVIYGAGQHTQRFLTAMADVNGGPAVSCIIDDSPNAAQIAGVPVCTPDNTDPETAALVIVSSDTWEEALTRRAEAWTRGKIPVERLYEGLDELKATPFFEDCGTVVAVDTDGTRRTIDELGASHVMHPTERANRAPSAIDPITERRVWSLDHPEFKLNRALLSPDSKPTLKEHQYYPGDTFRKGANLRDECLVTDPEHGLVTPDTRISVIGSCFAQNFRLWLIEHGYNFCQFEDGPFAEHSSVRTGPLFNTGSICQLFEWAFNGFDAVDPVWRSEGMLMDPYRLGLTWPTEQDMHAERASHFAAVRSMVDESEVLVLTLGLSEVWRNREDKRCYYLVPPQGILDERYHEHALLTVDDCDDHLERFYGIIRERNPSLRLVISLSPVPLKATYFDRNALQSDAVSKATIRTAMHWFCERHPEVVYFPSYEMVTRSPDWPYRTDNRHVVEHPFVSNIMKTFIEHYGAPGEADRLVEMKAAAERSSAA